MEAKSIKESLELLEGIKKLAVGVKKIAADGKVSMADLPVALGLLQEVPALVAAVSGADQVIPELKDLSQEELNQLSAKVLEVVAAIKAA